MARYWYEEDGRGNVVALTDLTGTVVDRYSYDAWGNLLGSSESVPQRLRYAGYWYDQEFGWYWVGVRYYDPPLGRWVQPDPSGQDGVRTYVYVDDDPVDASDPTGLNGVTPAVPGPTPNPAVTPTPSATPTPTAEPIDELTTERSIAEKFGYTPEQVGDAIHQLKKRGVGGPRVRNPNLVVNGKTGDVYVRRPDGSLSPDPIGNIHDEVDTRQPKRGRNRNRSGGWDRQWSSTRVQNALRTGAIAGGGAAVIWWVGKILSPACGPAAPVCVIAL